MSANRGVKKSAVISCFNFLFILLSPPWWDVSTLLAIYTPGWGEALTEQSYFAKEHNTGAEPIQVDLESCASTIRPLCPELSLHFESPAALILTPTTNLLLYRWMVSIKDKFTSNMKGSLCILGSNRLQIMTLNDSADASHQSKRKCITKSIWQALI